MCCQHAELAKRCNEGCSATLSTPAARTPLPVPTGVFFNTYMLFYLMAPRSCHAFVGYLEEEASNLTQPQHTACNKGREGGCSALDPGLLRRFSHLRLAQAVRTYTSAIEASPKQQRFGGCRRLAGALCNYCKYHCTQNAPPCHYPPVVGGRRRRPGHLGRPPRPAHCPDVLAPAGGIHPAGRAAQRARRRGEWGKCILRTG